MAVVKIQEKETKKQQRNIYSISKKGPLLCTCTHTHTHGEEHFLIRMLYTKMKKWSLEKTVIARMLRDAWYNRQLF